MALAHRTGSSAHAAASPPMIASSPPSPARPASLVGPCPGCFHDFAAVLIILVSFSCAGICVHYAARVLLHCLENRRQSRHAAREAARAQQDPKPDADGGSPVVAGAWAEAECAICLAELELEPESGERVRVRVLPACGHGFHAACVEAWLATRASCPTCRAPSSSRTRRPSSRTTGQP